MIDVTAVVNLAAVINLAAAFSMIHHARIGAPAKGTSPKRGIGN